MRCLCLAACYDSPRPSPLKLIDMGEPTLNRCFMSSPLFFSSTVMNFPRLHFVIPSPGLVGKSQGSVQGSTKLWVLGCARQWGASSCSNLGLTFKWSPVVSRGGLLTLSADFHSCRPAVLNLRPFPRVPETLRLSYSHGAHRVV